MNLLNSTGSGMYSGTDHDESLTGEEACNDSNDTYHRRQSLKDHRKHQCLQHQQGIFG